MFVHLHTHSNYSLLRGADSIENLCVHTKKRGMNALALTDTNGLYGLLWFLQVCEELELTPIVGAELKTEQATAVALVKNRAGYYNLCRIISALHIDPDFSLGQALLKNREGLILISPSTSLLARLGKSNGTEDLYVELVPGYSKNHLLEFSRSTGIPPVATNDVYFIDRDRYPLHRLLRAIGLNTSLSRIPESELAHKEAWLKRPADMAAYFPHCPEAIDNTLRIAEQCTFRLSLSRFIFPEFSSNGQKSPELLRKLCYAGVKRRYGEIDEHVRSRLEYELDTIISMGYADYFLVVHDIVNRFPRTCGRGSAAASLVSYALGITHVDPIKHHLFFERFLNVGRIDPPDIDVDFAWDERDDILDYVFEKYGTDRTGMVSNHVCFKTRAALHEIAKVYGLPEDEITKITKKLAKVWSRSSFDKILNDHPLFLNQEFPDPWPAIIRLAEQIRGYPKNMSVHCGGVVIVPDHIDHYVPRERAAKGVNIIQWDKDYTEEAGLVKLDLLGNRSLAVIRDSLQAIKQNYGIEIEYDRWNPLDDPATQNLIKNGDTIGVFYVESPAMRLLQQKSQKGDFDHLVIHSSIIRPAANDYIREYLARLKGKPYEDLHPLLKDILKETYGIMVYQEDVSKTAIALAGFTPAEADELRKILSKKHGFKRLRDLQKKFYEGARQKGVEEQTIEKIWLMILSFEGYSFCKPHSASYALVSYKSAYLRAHFPAEFMAAVISNQGGYYSTFAYISEARRMGLKVLLPDINLSRKEYTGKDDQLRVGFMQIKGLEESSIKVVLDEREKRPFASFHDFLNRARIDFNQVKLLIKAGVFDELEPHKNRPELIWELMYARTKNEIRKAENLSLFQQVTGTIPKTQNYDLRTILYQEQETLNFLISRHPLSLFQEKLKRTRFVKGKDLDRHVGETITMVGWLVTGKVVTTIKNEPMEFISFEDTTAIYETVFFPRTYQKFAHLLSNSRPYLLRGKVEQEFGAVTLNVIKIDFL